MKSLATDVRITCGVPRTVMPVGILMEMVSQIKVMVRTKLLSLNETPNGMEWPPSHYYTGLISDCCLVGEVTSKDSIHSKFYPRDSNPRGKHFLIASCYGFNSLPQIHILKP